MKQYGEEKIDRAFDIAIETIKFFPTIAEILEIINNLPPKWFNQKLEIETPTKEELNELENILNEMEG